MDLCDFFKNKFNLHSNTRCQIRVDISTIHVYCIGMYIRTTTRKNKNGTTTQYVQLAHNEWLPEAQRSNTKVLYNFGRREDVDIQSLERLVGSIKKFVGAEVPNESNAYGSDLTIESARALGGSWFLDQQWHRLEIDHCLHRLLKDRGYEIPIERAIFAMVANRILEPSSKLSCENWVKEEVLIPSLDEVCVHQLYRSMDFLVEHSDEIQKELFFSVATVINLEVDLIYFDTTSTYFEIDGADGKDTEVPQDDETGSTEDDENKKVIGLRQYGYNKDHRNDVPQIVIGMAVTKDGIPIRCWVFSGETNDVSIVDKVKKDLQGWRLNRVVSVMDRGFASEDNFVKLQSGGGHYIVGEKMRSGKPDVEAALSKKGRYTFIKENLYAKESVVGEGERRKRFVIAFNPKEAKKSQLTREKHLAAIDEKIKSFGDLKGKDYTKAVCALISHRVYGRYVKTLKNGSIKVDKATVSAEKRLDGKYLIRTSDDTLSIEDIVLGYKQLLIIERGFRTLKTDLELRPVYHRKPERIMAHVLLCFLALLMIRVTENEVGETWFHIERELRKLNLVSIKTQDSVVKQTTELTDRQKDIFKKCKLKMPPRVLSIDTMA